MKRTFLSIGVALTLLSAPAFAQVVDDEPELLLPDIAPFTEKGFEELPWRTGGPAADKILSEMLAPEYKARTGKDAPKDPLFEHAVLNLTGGDFNDVIVWSHLPGDCGENGCKVVLFRTVDGQAWKPAASFTAMTVLHRYAPKGGAPEFVAVGDDVIPTAIYQWDGKQLVEQ